MYTSIVTGTDGSPTADAAMGQAVELARRFGARVHLVNVGRPLSALVATSAEAMVAASEALDDQYEALRESLEKTARTLVGEGMDVTTHLVTGDPADTIVRVAEEVGADLIVVGSRGMRGARRLLGSVPNTVSHKAPCSVLIVRTT